MASAVPLLYVSPTQINAQMPCEYMDRTSVSLYARNTHADGSVTVTAPIAVTIVPQNPGIFAQYGSDPRPGLCLPRLEQCKRRDCDRWHR